MKKIGLLILLAIIALGGFFRFYNIKEVPPGLYPDEAVNGSNAQEALATDHFKVFYPENNGREGLFINMQAISVAVFGPTPWALRLVSAIVGTLTILGIYLVAHELFASNAAALLASFFLATSYWHLNFSRIGFRAIMLPFMATFGMYFLLKGLRRGKPYDLILAGLFTGLGLYTYIAFRFMVFVFAVPVVAVMIKWRRERKGEIGKSIHCIPCSIAMYAFVAFIAIIPIGLYFAQHPQDFLNRAGEVSVFASASPIASFAKSVGLTLQMFFYKGDGNWRHNLAYAPQLHPLAALFFVIGIATLIRRFTNYKQQAAILLVWFVATLLPVALTREGLPHALRAIGMIPPVIILAAFGANTVRRAINTWTSREKINPHTFRTISSPRQNDEVSSEGVGIKWPQKIAQLERIRRELIVFSLLALVTIPLATYRDYFLVWANNPETYNAFDTGHLHLAQYLASLPNDTKKYVIVNTLGTPVRGIPMPAQTIMYTTDTFTENKRAAKNFSYLLRGDVDSVSITADQKIIITLLDETDRGLIKTLQQKFPDMKIKIPGDFIVLQNY